MQDQTSQSDIAASGEGAHAFQADVSRLLHMMTHSVYSDRAIFLRELISNAADACEKFRFESVANPALASSDQGFAVRIEIDADASTLSVEDNGIGMDRQELAKALGTIAHSGTRAFMEAQQGANNDSQRDKDESAGDTGLIGQFGVGFYSAFMVADEVKVLSRKAGSEEAWRWISDGLGSYRIEKAGDAAAPAHGTRIILQMKKDAAEFLDPARIENMVREHSAAIQIPIDLVAKPGDEPRRISDGAALWNKPRSSVTPEQYAEFYRQAFRQFDEPALTAHWRAEGRNEYSVLAFIPGSRPFDLFDPARKVRGRLYVRRVLITEDADLLPAWLRFARVIVDAADIPLNISREMVQKSPIVAAIRKAVTSRIVQEIENLAVNDPEKFAALWKNFGAVIKEGLYEDPERRDQLLSIARFSTTKFPEGGRSLKDYVADIKLNQTSIYYIAGEDAKQLAASPQLEGFRSRGIEVLLLSDPVDAFWTSTALGFDGKPFKSATQATPELSNIDVETGQGPEAAIAVDEGELAAFMAFAKQTLADVVDDVRTSDKLSESPACLVASDKGMDKRLEKILAEHGQLGSLSKAVLELNPRHELVAQLSAALKTATDRSGVEDAVWLLFEEARMIEGERASDTIAFRQRLFRMMKKSLVQ